MDVTAETVGHRKRTLNQFVSSRIVECFIILSRFKLHGRINGELGVVLRLRFCKGFAVYWIINTARFGISLVNVDN